MGGHFSSSGPHYQGQHLRFRVKVRFHIATIDMECQIPGKTRARLILKDRYFRLLVELLGSDACGLVFWISSPQRQAVEVFESGVHM